VLDVVEVVVDVDVVVLVEVMVVDDPPLFVMIFLTASSNLPLADKSRWFR